MRSEFSDDWAVASAEAIVALVEKDLIDVVTSEDFEVVRDINVNAVGLSRFFDFSLKRTDENKRVRRPAQLGNLKVQRDMVGVVKRCLSKSLVFK